MPSREKILNAIKKAVKTSSHLPEKPDYVEKEIESKLTSITPLDDKGFKEQFEKELQAVSGELVTVSSEKILVEHLYRDMLAGNNSSIAFMGTDSIFSQMSNLSDIQCLNTVDIPEQDRKATLANTQASLVSVDYAIADVASLVVLLDNIPSLFPHYLPDSIYVVVKPDQLVANMFELMEIIPDEKKKNMLFITGPSRTADIEKILILGAHGPRKLTVYWLES